MTTTTYIMNSLFWSVVGFVIGCYVGLEVKRRRRP